MGGVMSEKRVFVKDTELTDIASAIREKNGTEETYKPSEMGSAIRAIESGSDGVLSGSFTPADNLQKVTVDVGKPFKCFLCQANEDAINNGVKITQSVFLNDENKIGTFISSNNAGTAFIAGSFEYKDDMGKYDTSIANSYVAVSDTKITMACATSGTTLGYFVSGITYSWYAW